MGSSARFDSERRELVRERREARMERERERRQAREHKRSESPAGAFELSDVQLEAEQNVRLGVDRIVDDALDRHDQLEASARPAEENAAQGRESAEVAAVAVGESRPVAVGAAGPVRGSERRALSPRAVSGPRVSRRERDIAEFRERRQLAASEARREARGRIVRQGEPAAVADALGATSMECAPWWPREREQLDRALAGGRVADVGSAARRAVWAVCRDAARSSQRSGRDPELALAVGVAYAIIAALPRTALRSVERARPAPTSPGGAGRAFWR